MIACTALLLGALLIYGEREVGETEDLRSVNVFVKVAEKERSRDFAILKKGEGYISEENVYNRGAMSSTKVGPFNGDGDGKDGMDLVTGFSSKITEKEIQTEKTVTNATAARDLGSVEKELFSIENSGDHTLQIAEGLKVEIEKPLDSQFDSSLGSPWQQVNSHDVSSGSESEESDGEESSSPDTSTTDVVPIIDELHPLLQESENPQPAHRSSGTSDDASRASSPEREFDDDGSAEEETENQADDEDEEAQEEKDNGEAVVKWTADDQKNLMDLGSSELERNQRLENLIAKRRAKKLQRFQTDKNLIDLDTEPLPFMEEISRLNVQIPAISAPRSNPFDLPFDSEENFRLLPIPGSAPSVLLPRRNPFDLPYDQNEESSKFTGESSRPYDVSISQRDSLPRRIDNLNLGTVSDDVNQEKNAPKLKPYFIPEKISGTSFTSFENQLSEESGSDESSDSESDSASAVFNQDHELPKLETLERVSSNQDVGSVEGESDLSVEVGSAILDQEHNGADSVQLELGEVESTSPVSSTANLEVIDERYDGSNSSPSSEEDDKCIETSIHLEAINSARAMGDSPRSFTPIVSVAKPGLPVKEAELTHDSQVDEPNPSGTRVEGADDSQAADPVYDCSPSGKSSSHIPTLEALFSDVKGKTGFSTGPSLASDMQANLREVFSTPKAFEQGATSEEGDSILVRESMSPVLHNYIDEVRSDPKVEGLNEASDEVDTVLEADAGSSPSFDGNLQMKDANLLIPEPSVVERSHQETLASSTSESVADNSETTRNPPTSLNSKDKLGHTELI